MTILGLCPALFNATTGLHLFQLPADGRTFHVLEQYQEVDPKNLLAEYFGEPAVIATRKWVIRVVAPREVGDGWHQDGQFMGAKCRSPLYPGASITLR